MKNVRLVWSFLWRILAFAFFFICSDYFRNPEQYASWGSSEWMAFLWMAVVLLATSVAMNFIYAHHLLRKQRSNERIDGEARKIGIRCRSGASAERIKLRR